MVLGTETYVLRWLHGETVPSTHREEWLLKSEPRTITS
jgi:hypothetical protein